MIREDMERELLAQPVRSLQYMLRRLAQRYPKLPELAVDGVFGEKTLEAVMRLQRELQLPITGVVDRTTWNAIRDGWLALETERAMPRSLRAFPGEGVRVRPGEERDFLGVPQAMFQMLGRYFTGIAPHTVDAVHGPASVGNVRWLQRASGQPETGVLDRRTWEMLSRLYEAFVVKNLEEEGLWFMGGWG